jgi:uncharacterized protein (TIRG00374 family)
MPRRQPWMVRISWVLGAVLLGAVVYVGLRSSEERAFVSIARRAQPGWLAAAVALQIGTYFSEGEIWGVVIRVAKVRVSPATTFRLSVAKLFVDQAVPSAGISGTLVFARALESAGMPRAAVRAAVVVGSVSYHLVYVLSLAVALVLLIATGHATVLIVVTSAVFAALAIGLSLFLLSLSRRSAKPLLRMRKMPLVRNALELIADADRGLVRSHQLLATASGLQLAIVVLDAATVWVLCLSLGTTASPVGVFASFMVSSLFRTVGIVPGGLGTFEAASVLTLRMTHVPLAVALAATLLFRGLSFWLPLAPGLWFARRAVVQPRASRSPPGNDGSERSQ